MDLESFGFLMPLLINFILLYNRKKDWAKSKYRYYSALILFLTGLTFLIINQKFVISFGLISIFLFSLIDYFTKQISFRIHNRDIFLWLRWSNEIDDFSLSGGKHVRASDRLLSLVLLISAIMLPLLGLMI